MSYTPPPQQSIIVKTSDQTRTSTTTYAADNTLVLSLATGLYSIRAVIYMVYNGLGGFKVKFTGTNLEQAPLRYRAMVQSPIDADAPGEAAIHVLNPEFVAAATATDDNYHARVSLEFDDLITLTASGSIQLEWAQATSDDGGMTVKAHSFIQATRLFWS